MAYLGKCTRRHLPQAPKGKGCECAHPVHLRNRSKDAGIFLKYLIQWALLNFLMISFQMSILFPDMLSFEYRGTFFKISNMMETFKYFLKFGITLATDSSSKSSDSLVQSLCQTQDPFSNINWSMPMTALQVCSCMSLPCLRSL